MAVSEPAAKGFQFPYTIRMERRLTTPKWLPVATSIGALVVAFFIGGIVIRAAGGQPVSAYGHIVEAAFGSLGVFNDTMVKATPLILVGLACALAFRMKLWNIGAEGQFFLGAWGAERGRAAPHPAGRHPAPDYAGRDGCRRLYLRRAVGFHPRLPQGQVERQRDHHDPHDELHRGLRGCCSGSSARGARAVSRCRRSSRRAPGCRACWSTRACSRASGA